MRRCLIVGSFLLLSLSSLAQKPDINFGTRGILLRSRGGTGVNSSNTFVQTGTDINGSFQVTALHLPAPTLCNAGSAPRGIDGAGNSTGCGSLGAALNAANLWTKAQTIQPDTDVPAGIDQAANVTTPTADLRQWKDKSGTTVLSRIQSDGTLKVGSTAATLSLGMTGTPTGSCNNGSIWTRVDGSGGSTLYSCEGSAWVAK